MAELIRAAGGVLHRSGSSGVEIAVIHRPRHDDWSLPKGKRKRNEHPVVAAAREVWEETGVRPSLGARLPSVSYRVPLPDGSEADKAVEYWTMSCAHDDGFVPGNETDELAWLTVDEALQRLSYDRDVFVVKAFEALPALRPPIVVVRHASAGDRHAWAGPDDERPLDDEGAERARLLAEVFACFGASRLISAGPRRCRDTLLPAATALVTGSVPAWMSFQGTASASASVSVSVSVEHVFDDEADPQAAAARLLEYTRSDQGGATVICSQGTLIPGLVANLAGGPASSYRTAKGRGWVLSFAIDDMLAALDPLD